MSWAVASSRKPLLVREERPDGLVHGRGKEVAVGKSAEGGSVDASGKMEGHAASFDGVDQKVSLD